MPSPQDATALLLSLEQGDSTAFDALFPLIYDELRLIAHRIRRSGAHDTMNTTALVHEVYLKLVDQTQADWQSRAHFLAVAARAMRHLLINYAKAQQAQKRGGGLAPLPLEDDLLADEPRPDEVLALDEALTELARMDERQARVVELRFFGGLTVEETALVLEVSPVTVKRDWATSRAWLYQRVKTLLG